MSNSTAASPEPDAVRKRRRIALACDECRERKRKCDGVKPVCGACSRRSARRCVWNEDRNTKAWSNSYVEGLKSRIRELEEAQAVTNGAALMSTESSSEAIRRYAHHDASPLQQLVEPQAPAPPPQIEPAHLNINACYPDAPAGSASIGANSVSDSGSMSAAARPRFSFGSSGRATSPLQGFREGSFDVFGSDSGETGMDGMGVVGSVEDASGPGAGPRARRQSDYFGPSSTLSLLSKARNVLGRRCCGHGPLLSVGSEPCASCRDEATSMGTSRTPSTRNSGFRSINAMFGLSLPPRAEADSLVGSYWKEYHSLYPFLHRPSFCERYRSLWSLPEKPQIQRKEETHRRASDYYDGLRDRCFYCLLNVVFALGALFNLKIDKRHRDSVSRSFFERAKKLVDLDLLAQGNIGLVQTLLLMGQYLQSTDMSSSCWNIVGLAIRVAQCIGLHHEPRGGCEQGCCPKSNFDQLDTEMRRRTWAGCVLLDRVLSLTYGRPLMIHPTTTQRQLILPSAIDDQFLTRLPDPPGSQSEDSPSVTECYVQAIKLQDILGQVLAAFYYAAPDSRDEESTVFDLSINYMAASVMGGGVKTSDFQMLLDVDSLLTTWHKRLPTHLKVQTYGNTDFSSGCVDPEREVLYQRQAVVLETRYLHVRLTMLRPVLSVLCDMSRRSGTGTPDDDSIESNMRQGMLFKAARLCLSVTQDLVNVITEKAQSRLEVLPAPWYNVFYIHSSAMVFLLGYLCSLKHANIMDRTSLADGFNRCLSFLRGYESQSRSAQKCSKILDLIKQEVFTDRSADGTVSLHAGLGQMQLREQRPAVATAVNRQTEQDYLNLNFDLRNEDPFSPGMFPEGPLDQAWMWNPSDMTWLSFMPFLEDQSNFPAG